MNDWSVILRHAQNRCILLALGELPAHLEQAHRVLTQEVLGLARLLPVRDDEIAHTLADVFLHGVVGAPAPEPA